MAPTTRLSGGYGSNHSPTNLDNILENFNQFKRKHITQNRDIIKTNALAQLRIKELEEKVLQLEGERAERSLEMIRIRANMDRVERASKSLIRGWHLFGAGLATMAAIDGFKMAEPSSERGDGDGRDAMQQPKPSARIVLDPHALPGGVSRSVARAPEAQLLDVTEEDSRAEAAGGETEDGMETAEVDSSMAGEETNNVSFSKETTLRMDDHDADAERPCSTVHALWTSDEPEDAGSSDSLVSVRELIGGARSVRGNVGQQLHRATSIDSLSSFTDDEEVQLSDDDFDECEEDVLAKILHDSKVKGAERSSAVTSRKKSPSTSKPDDSSLGNISTSINTSRSSSEDEQSPMMRSSRRSSVRDRKSINYALPKLNTKMRKPDPVDLIPALEGEARTAEEEGDGMGGSSRESTPKRSLKGGHEAASTGNLREIRKQHQSARDEVEGERSNGEEEDLKVQDSQPSRQGPMTRRRSSNGHQQTRRGSPVEGESSESDDRRKSPFEGTDLSSSSSASSNVAPPSWKASSALLSSHPSSVKPAMTGTPMARNHGSRNIKALKVANRIQKKPVGPPATFASDGRRPEGTRPASVHPAGAVSASNAAAGAVGGNSGAKVLTPSAKLNLGAKQASGPSGEAKRSSLHAAMTLEDEDQRSTFSGER